MRDPRSIKIRKLLGATLAVAVAVGGQVGCAKKAKPATEAGFATSAPMGPDPSLPFHKVWHRPGFEPARYKKLYVADVSTDYMLAMTDWQKGMRREEFEADVRQLAVHTRDAIKKAFREDPKSRFTVIETPIKGPDTLVLEVALTEVVPSKVVLNLLGYAPYGIGMTIQAVRMMKEDRSTVAFEARVLDAATGDVVLMMADREAEQKAPVSAKGLSWYGHANGIIDAWAKQFVQIANRKPGEVIEDTAAFTLKPW